MTPELPAPSARGSVRLMPKVKAALADSRRRGAAHTLAAEGRVVLDVDGGDGRARAPTTSRSGPEAHEEFVLAEDGGLRGGARHDPRRRAARRGSGPRAGPHAERPAQGAGFELSDRIRVELSAGGVVAEAAPRRHGDWIAEEVLAVDWEVTEPTPPGAGVLSLDVDGTPVGRAPDPSV